MEDNGNYKPNDEFVTAIWNLRFVMRVLGTWQQPDSRGWYNLVWYVQSVGVSFHMFGPAAGLVINRNDASKFINNLSVLLSLISIFVNWMILGMYSKTIGQLLHFMEEDWINLEKDTLMNRSVPDSKMILVHHYRAAKTFFLFGFSMIAFCDGTFVYDSLSSRNLLNNETDIGIDGLFVVPYSWFPVDYSRGHNLEILYWTQILTLAIIGLASVSCDNLFVTVTYHLCAQFQILRHFIENIEYDSSLTKCCGIKVEMMIRRHQELLSVAEKIQNPYNFILAVQYMTATLSICFLGYTLVSEMEKTEPSTPFMMKSGFLIAAYLVLMFAYCSVSDYLTEQSGAIVMAIYSSDWYNCPRSICLSFLIVMARAGRPVEISGAKLFPISLESFMNLLKASASYLSVLRAMGVSSD